jgi:hypothetical protein
MTSRARVSGRCRLARKSRLSSFPSASRVSHRSRRASRALVAAEKIALADDADQRAAVVDDRHRADRVREQQSGDLAHRRVGARGCDLARHHIACLHRIRPVVLSR